MALYDRLGRTYTRTRDTDPRLAAVIWAALGDARTVVNVGAGTGSYEPPDRELTAVEPSEVMIAQRLPEAAPVVCAAAEALPFADDTFDAAMAVLTLHHWEDWRAGVREMCRVARDRVVIFTWDPSFAGRFWLSAEYFGAAVDRVVGGFATLAEVTAAVGGASIVPVPVPHDCRDGFFSAYWRHPEAYLDPEVRAGISTFAVMPDADEQAGLERLREDLESGAWRERHRDLAELDALDVGFRLLVAPAAGAAARDA